MPIGERIKELPKPAAPAARASPNLAPSTTPDPYAVLPIIDGLIAKDHVRHGLSDAS